MGEFFEDKDVQTKRHHGVIAATWLMLFGFVIALLSWILKPLLVYLFTLTGISDQEKKIKLIIIICIFGGGAYALYTVPSVRDMVSLSNEHTINVYNDGHRIPFPDRSAFIANPTRTMERVPGKTDILYGFYATSMKDLPQYIPNGLCQLVPRSTQITFFSEKAPNQVEGFRGNVEYVVIRKLFDVPMHIHLLEMMLHPTYFLKNNKEKHEILVQYFKYGTWKEFLEDWSDIKKDSDDNKLFIVRSLSDEHAMICIP